MFRLGDTSEETDGKANALSVQLEELLAGMQTPAARQGMEAAFNASPAELGRAAVKAADEGAHARQMKDD